jgi:hypothetical protein
MKGLIFVALVFLTLPSFAREELPRSQSVLAQEMMRREIADMRQKLFEANMAALSTEDRGKFWEIYSAYDREKTQLDDAGLKILDQYVTNYLRLNGAQVSVLMGDLTKRQQQQLKLREKTYKAISKQISPALGARFFQLDGYLEAVQRIKSLEMFPLMGNPLQK